MVITTRITLGSRETPSFVCKEFFYAVQSTTQLYEHYRETKPKTIRYYVPEHLVVKSPSDPSHLFSVDVDDENMTPTCRKTQILTRLKYRHRTPRVEFDRFSIVTENRNDGYFLVLPNARYHHTTIYADWSVSTLVYDNKIWHVHFRRVYTDPHDLNQTIWFFSQPKYQIEIETEQDFRGREKALKKAVLMIIPRAFRWEST